MNLTGLGSFRLPAGKGLVGQGLPAALHQFAKFGFGGRAMCLSGDRGHLWISGHDVGDLVAQVRIPEAFDGRTAGQTVGFHEVTPRVQLAAAKLDALVGLADHEGKLWALWNQYYDLDGTDGGRASLWDGEQLVRILDGRIKRTSGYLTAHDGALWCGRSDGAGNPEVHHGPALYRIDSLGSRWWWNHDRADWNEADKYTALAFLPGYACFLVAKAVGPTWYGQGNMPNRKPDWFDPTKYGFPEEHWAKAWQASGIVDPWQAAQGYHTTERAVWLMLYTWPGLVEKPVIRFAEFHSSAKVGGMVFDLERRLLYVHEQYPPAQDAQSHAWERGKVHVYQVEADDASDPDPEDERAKIREAERLLEADASDRDEIIVVHADIGELARYPNTERGRLEAINGLSEELRGIREYE